MKKILMSLAIIVIAGAAANAQQTDKKDQPARQGQFRHGEGKKHYGEGRLAKKLNFTDQQKQQLKDINTDFRKKIADLKKKEDITVRESKAGMDALQKEHRSQMQALLTPAQKEALAKMKKDRMEMAKVNAGARAEKMKIKLGLNDAQANQIKTIRTDMMAKMKTIHTDNSLSREQKREQIKSLVMQQKDQLKTILTPEQLQQLA